jgi:putative nucleotidyltransferase with HDIG domain
MRQESIAPRPIPEQGGSNVSWPLIAGDRVQQRTGYGQEQAVDLAVAQACRLPGIEGALILIAAGADRDALRVIAAAGDGAPRRDAVVAPARLGRLGVTAQVAVCDSAGERLGTLAVITGDAAADGAELHEALDGLAALAGLGWRGADRTAAVGRMFEAGVGALAKLLDLRDGYTGSHAEEVVALCDKIARHLQLPAVTVRELEMAARLHDLGKIGVPDVILHKPGRLTPAEWEVMRKHPGWGAEALASVPGGAAVAAAVRGHHERWDGRGYPDELSGEQIPIASRIIAVADAWHAMTSNRSYRRALDDEHARQELCDGAGLQFDPAVVDALLVVTAADPDRAGRFHRDGESDGNGDATPAPIPAATGGDARRRRASALSSAIARVSRLPALRESRERLAQLLGDPATEDAQLLGVVESDLALTAAVIRAANALGTADRPTTTIPDAVRQLSREQLADVAGATGSIDYFQHIAGWEKPLEHLRLHAMATQRATDLISRMLHRDDRDTLLVGALLHDIGKLVLEQSSPGYPRAVHGDADTPDSRVRAERRALGIDHALVGALMLRRWAMPEEIAKMVEGHHAVDAEGPAAVLRLADMLAHYVHARPVDPQAMLHAAGAAGLSPQQLRALMFDMSRTGDATPRATEPSPLSRAQTTVLRGLAEGKIYKEIAADMGLSASTVRTHCHNVYRKLGVADRSQAVLHAASRGWL